METIKAEEQKEKRLMKCDLWDTIKRTNIHTVGVPEGERKGQKECLKK